MSAGHRLPPCQYWLEYKLVTVLFVDMVHSMDVAAAVDAERLREIMTELVDHSTSVVQRYGGTVDKFTGDGIMAIFGAPAALEDHALRACLAALGVQAEAKRLAVEVDRRDGVTLQVRVGLNSGQVVAGGIGSGTLGYTAIGEHVGLAQRMESVASPGAVMLSESTAKLVGDATVLGEPEVIRIKGAQNPVSARRLLSVLAQGWQTGPSHSTLVGRGWELTTLATMLDRSIGGRGCVVGMAGRAGIGKTRLVREAVQLAKSRGVLVPLQATIAARVDRLSPLAKRTLSAAAVIGSRFSSDLLLVLGIDPLLDEPIKAELVDQIRFAGHAEYAFRYPLIHAVAYESQLKSERAQMHRQLAAALEAREPESVDQNAGLVAEHLEAAGDLHAAYGWYVRAAKWGNDRDVAAANLSWERARKIADALPADDPERDAMRVGLPPATAGPKVIRGGGRSR